MSNRNVIRIELTDVYISIFKCIQIQTNTNTHTHTHSTKCVIAVEGFHLDFSARKECICVKWKRLEQGGGDSQRNKSGIKIRAIKATPKNIYKSPQIKQDGLILSFCYPFYTPNAHTHSQIYPTFT